MNSGLIMAVVFGLLLLATAGVIVWGLVINTIQRLFFIVLCRECRRPLIISDTFRCANCGVMHPYWSTRKVIAMYVCAAILLTGLAMDWRFGLTSPLVRLADKAAASVKVAIRPRKNVTPRMPEPVKAARQQESQSTERETIRVCRDMELFGSSVTKCVSALDGGMAPAKFYAAFSETNWLEGKGWWLRADQHQSKCGDIWQGDQKYSHFAWGADAAFIFVRYGKKNVCQANQSCPDRDSEIKRQSGSLWYQGDVGGFRFEKKSCRFGLRFKKIDTDKIQLSDVEISNACDGQLTNWPGIQIGTELRRCQ